jgi:aryl-alcohol dehydrogenase-like predicted oxidoreductase
MNQQHLMRKWLPRNIQIPALGMGCWAIGGPFSSGQQPLGWGEVDDNESVSAIHAALEAGIRFFDTSDAYGTGHSETVLRQALYGRAEKVVIATKFGNTYDASKRQLTGIDVSPDYIRSACDASRKRLGLDQIALYQLHVDDVGELAPRIQNSLEQLCDDGVIAAYGWSTDNAEQASLWRASDRLVSMQHAFNLFQPAPEMRKLCTARNLISINRSPLAMGLLTAKFDSQTHLSATDIRMMPPDWLPFFSNGRPKHDFVEKIAAVRELLSSDGRTLAQGALGWIWSKSDHTLPIPGFRTVAQVQENARALEMGALPPGIVDQIDQLLAST